MEYCGILYLTDVQKRKSIYKKVDLSEEAKGLRDKNGTKDHTRTRPSLANHIEKIARILIPFYNIVFPMIYFLVCLL